jgi:hypothetical protein
MFITARWWLHYRKVSNHSLLAARTRPVFTLRHIRPFLFVPLPIGRRVKRLRSRIVDSGECRLVLCRQLYIWCDRPANPLTVHIQEG